MLPPPTLAFTIPSIHDDLELQCKIYHPTCLAPVSAAHCVPWKRKAAIIAHPYAPLGGCQDDPVVGFLGTACLKEGFVVGTFNFRGVTGGKTTWQGKGEQNDYISFIGFMVYYMHHLSPPDLRLESLQFTQSEPELYNLTPVQSQVLPQPRTSNMPYITSPIISDDPFVQQQDNSSSHPRLLLAGYSYGALITTTLPPILNSLLHHFSTPQTASSHASIRLRACHLAAQQSSQICLRINTLLQSATISNSRGRSLHADSLTSAKLRGGLRMGGEENLRRASHESHRSISSIAIETPERIRKSIDRVRSITRAQSKRESPKRTGTQKSIDSYQSRKDEGSHSSIEQESRAAKTEDTLEAVFGLGDGLQTAYLIVSPLQGIVSSLITMWGKSSKLCIENERKFTIDPTLVLFGDDDMFVSVKKLRAWAQGLSSSNKGGKEDGNFRYVEVPGAGHFWHDHDAVRTLQEEVGKFLREI